MFDECCCKYLTIFKRRMDANWSFIDSLWWCVMTLTTVGSNHSYPSTRLGQLIGALCTVSGVFILSLPIPIVVNSFAISYKNRMWRNEVAHNKAQQLQIARRRLNKDIMNTIINLEDKGSETSSCKSRRRKRLSMI